MDVGQTPDATAKASPWWHHGMMWLVVGGPLLVVVASCITAVIAIMTADVLVDESGNARSGAYAPAIKARNHVVTPQSPPAPP